MADHVVSNFTPYEPTFTQRISIALPKFIDYVESEYSIAINFSAALDAEEQDILTDVVENNQPRDDLEYKIYDYVGGWDQPTSAQPQNINYLRQLTTRLHPQKKRVFGELCCTTYYGDKIINQDNTATYSNPVIKETFYYSRDPITNILSERRLYIQWYFADGTLDNKFKLRVKNDYVDDFASAIREISAVRNYNVLEIIESVIPMILLTDSDFTTTQEVLEEGRRFLETFTMERSVYIRDGNSALETGVRNQDTTAGVGDFFWLDNSLAPLGLPLPTIRSFIINELSRGERTS